MNKVLYISNIEVPYRNCFFNEFSRACDLTVLYEREKSSNRNTEWTQSKERNYRVKYLKGIKIGGENGFSLGILKEIFSDYDCIVVGCYNSPVQMLAILTMRLFHIPYCLNLDGDPFLVGNGLKTKLKRFFLNGADKYLVAGEGTAHLLRQTVKGREIIPYYFSSLSQQEIKEHEAVAVACRRNDTILVIGQYYDYKGMDVALKAACMAPWLQFKFVGMGTRTEQFLQEHQIPENVEVIPFLQKKDLEREYQSCGMLVLPSRQECWGLVINEAASFGMPIVSTWGSGAAVEFLGEDYPQLLAQPDDAGSLLAAIETLRQGDFSTYSEFLIRKNKNYSVEACVKAHTNAVGKG